MWLEEEDCLKVIKKGWIDDPTKDVYKRMQRCKATLSTWGTNNVWHFQQNISRIKCQVEKLQHRRDPIEAQCYEDARRRYFLLLKQQEGYWKQRAKIRWLREGDANTKYFHAMATNKKWKNKVDCLMDDAGFGEITRMAWRILSTTTL